MDYSIQTFKLSYSHKFTSYLTRKMSFKGVNVNREIDKSKMSQVAISGGHLIWKGHIRIFFYN